MLKLLSALACLTFLLGSVGVVTAQMCPPATIGVYFDVGGTMQTVTPIQNQDLYMYVVMYVEGPVGGAAWQLVMSSPQYSGPILGPPGPNCQPPWCAGEQDPPFWYMGFTAVGPVVMGDPFNGGVRQGLGSCYSGFFGNPVLLATVRIRPWADMLAWTEVDITVIPEVYEGLVWADCDARLCFDVAGLTSRLGVTAVANETKNWGAVKALYR
jgi:hypothetical protein